MLVTGGAGFIGFHLSRHLAGQGYDVTICDNFFRGSRDDELKALLKQPNVSLIECDMADSSCVTLLGAGYDYVYHLAAINGTRYFYEIPDKVLRVNILSAINVLDWFVKSGSGKILFASSCEAYASNKDLPLPTPEDVPLAVSDVKNSRFSYGGSKIAGELLFYNYAKVHKFRMTILRYHNLYGPRMGFEHVVPEFCMRLIKKEDPFRIIGGKDTRSFCYCDDGVRATQQVMESEKTDGEIIHTGNSTEEISIVDLAGRLMDIAGFHPEIKVSPAPEGSVNRRCPDLTKIKALTGYEPEIMLEDGLKKTLAWYRDNHFGHKLAK
ncbi:MAG: NAD-dependent epimerase/dehydratase family protein [archaeon]